MIKKTNNTDYKARNNTDYKTRRVKEKEMIFGIRSVIEAIDAGKTIDKVLLRRDMSSALARELAGKLQATPTHIQRVPLEKLNQLTDKNHQGVIAFISPIDFCKVEDIVPMVYEQGRTPLLVALDGITDMRNFGAIARTCLAAGVDALIIPASGGVAINGDAVKTSAGALHRLPICKSANMPATLDFLRDSGLRVVAVSEHSSTICFDTPLTEPLVLVLGSEDNGISEACLRRATDRVAIPMSGEIESLNVSVAAGVLIYEVIRQRR